jgi:hypothetical protein
MTQLWYSELQPLWRRELRPIAGLTAYAALFCLERLAWDHGMRVVYHGAHTPLASGDVDHVVHGPWSVRHHSKRGSRRSSDAHREWPTDLADRIARQARKSGWTGLPPALCAVAACARTPGLCAERSFEQPLHSWVIARPARHLERT